MQRLIYEAFDGRAYVVDKKNQTLALCISPTVDIDELKLIVAADVLPRPITFNYNIIINAEPNKTFGFANNKTAKGFSSISNPKKGGIFARIVS